MRKQPFNDGKGGVALLAKMVKIRIMPVTYTGPTTIKDLVSRERMDMNFGNPIDYVSSFQTNVVVYLSLT